MIASRLLIQNRTRTDLHLVVRPFKGTLLIMLLSAAANGTMDVPPGASAVIPKTEAIMSCMTDASLRIEVRNRSGLTTLALQHGHEVMTGDPAIIILDESPEKDDA